MKKSLIILPLLFFTFSCSISSKNIINNRDSGFFFQTKSKYLKINDENYKILFPKKINKDGKLIVKIKPENGNKIEKEISENEYLKVQEILKSNNKLSNENKKTIQKILNINS